MLEILNLETVTAWLVLLPNILEIQCETNGVIQLKTGYCDTLIITLNKTNHMPLYSFQENDNKSLSVQRILKFFSKRSEFHHIRWICQDSPMHE